MYSSVSESVAKLKTHPFSIKANGRRTNRYWKQVWQSMSIFMCSRLLTSILANILNPQRALHYKLPFTPIIHWWQQPETPYHQRHFIYTHTLIKIIKGLVSCFRTLWDFEKMYFADCWYLDSHCGGLQLQVTKMCHCPGYLLKSMTVTSAVQCGIEVKFTEKIRCLWLETHLRNS